MFFSSLLKPPTNGFPGAEPFLKTEYKRPLITVAIIVAGLVLSYLALTLRPAPAPRPPEPDAPHPAHAMEVRLASHAVRVTSQGTVAPRTEIDVTSQVSGQVVEVGEAFAAGGRFSAGDVLLRIDPRDYEVRQIQAESRHAEARKNLALERGQARQAEREWRELGNPEANALALRQPQLAAAEAAARAAEADVLQARLDLERTEIRLPFDGRVVSTAVNLGQFVNVGTTLGRVFGSEVMEVRLPLTIREMSLLNLKNPAGAFEPLAVSLSMRAGDRVYRWQGRLVRVEPRADTASRLYHVVVEVSGATGEESPPLMPGSFVEAVILSNPFPGAFVVPRDALYQRDRLLVLDEDMRLAVVPVEVLEVGPDRAVVRGVADGALVLTEPPVFLEVGATYQPTLVPGPDSVPGESAYPAVEMFEAEDVWQGGGFPGEEGFPDEEGVPDEVGEPARDAAP